jgi:hypothetical protein
MAAMKNEVNGPLMLVVGAISIILIVTAAVAVDGWYKSVEEDEVTAKWDQSPNTWLADLRAKQVENLEYSHKIPHRPPLYHVTVSDAMKIVANNNGKLAE